MMARPAFLERLFPQGAPLFYAGTFKASPFTRQWTIVRETAEGYQFQLFLELDLRPINQGVTVMKERVLLDVDRDLGLVRYVGEAAGARVVLTFNADTISAVLPDGTKLELERKGARFLVEANLTGLDAVAIAIVHERGELETTAVLQPFLVNSMMTIPYSITRATGTAFVTSHEEELVIEDGVLVSTYLPKADVRFVRAAAPPLPAWAGQPGGTRPAEILRYVPPSNPNFVMEDVSIATSTGEVGGTLTTPTGQGRFPAILFLSGTGTHDRHGIAGTIDLGTHEIVDQLADLGIAGLRFDTRGAGTTKLGGLDTGLGPLIEHARLWFQYLANRPNVDPSRIVVVGHSQGGTIALLITGEQGVPANGVALLATPGRRMHELLVEQVVQQATSLGLTEEQRDRNVAQLQKVIAAVIAGASFEAGSVPDSLVPVARQVAWFKDHLDVDPVGLVARLRCRLWIAQGGKDFQVSTLDADRLERAAHDASLDVTRVDFPDLDHLFKFCEGPSTLDQYHDRTRRVDRSLIEGLAAWIKR